ncbi:lipoprotein signal peptidase [Malaciobacter pacificus]|jgi:signal peptidase II|uniref:Lipoprotein signal peptidase n=1 Tax=Malaciobacter pacificus TaxID=1080223 RepID=A0A5C2H3Q6_9BACT|nr:signal peptidase II [Malaciobacter pacificus]QEP33363.1 prolipoprotein signal peptidase II [Malaciobacter pacificus]GGD30786.1 lipoprotein signal peptidase [Malaciobacter pacificus]
MSKHFKTAFIIFLSIFIIDQIVKFGFANFDWNVAGPIMSLELAYNYGVAFSMFSFLQEYLKYIQLAIVFGATMYLYKNPDVFKEYYISVALLFAGGLSNILDRFTYGAVVDYFYWHYGFEFAIFNIADVIINLGVAIILYKQFKQARKEKQKTENS